MDQHMTKREIGMILASVLVLGSLTLWGAIYAIDNYAFGDDTKEFVLHKR
jgi:hypothetical protein